MQFERDNEVCQHLQASSWLKANSTAEKIESVKQQLRRVSVVDLLRSKGDIIPSVVKLVRDVSFTERRPSTTIYMSGIKTD